MKDTEGYERIAEYLDGLKTSRFSISIPCLRTLKLDHVSFEQAYAEELSGSLVCRILVNYCRYALDNFKTEFTEGALLYISENSKNSFQKKYSGVIDVTKELKDILSLCGFDKTLRTGRFKERLSELHFGRRDISSFILKEKLSQLTPPERGGTTRFRFSSGLFSYILERFSAMNRCEREKVYCYEQYKVITECINKKNMLRVKTDSGRSFEMMPYLCTEDRNVLSYYAAGYSRSFGSTEPFRCHSNRLIRIAGCTPSGGKFSLTAEDERRIKKLCDHFGPAYLIDIDPDDIKTTKVTLTEYGYKQLFLRIISHQRPLPVKAPEEIAENGNKLYVLYFDCSHNQLRNYFRPFGDNAVIKAEYQEIPDKE
ncbi:MAG: hypothetical protein II059_08335 [Clostridia bacterium]|nr:hypothetical protein [Clostridia bacterium]